MMTYQDLSWTLAYCAAVLIPAGLAYVALRICWGWRKNKFKNGVK